jgi:hypothetical protein
MTNRETLVQYLRDDIADTRLVIEQMRAEGRPAAKVMAEQDRLCRHEKKLSDLLEQDMFAISPRPQ